MQISQALGIRPFKISMVHTLLMLITVCYPIVVYFLAFYSLVEMRIEKRKKK